MSADLDTRLDQILANQAEMARAIAALSTDIQSLRQAFTEAFQRFQPAPGFEDVMIDMPSPIAAPTGEMPDAAAAPAPHDHIS